MSLAYFIVVNHDAPGFDTFVNGKAVAKQSEQLDALAKRLGVIALEDFSSTKTCSKKFRKQIFSGVLN
jgi:hypothetical protein